MNDFLIIGGGINGLLLARELAANQADVALLERGECCREASWAGGGIVSPLYPWRYGSEITALSTWAQDFYPELAQTLLSDTGIDPEFSQSGLLMLEAEDASQALEWATDSCRRMERVDGNFIYGHESNLAPGFGDGLWMPDVANIRNPQLGEALIADLKRRRNVRIVQRCQVKSFERRGDSIVAVESRIGRQKTRFSARQIILCTGAWSGSLAQKLRVTLKVEPVKGQMLLYDVKETLVNSIVLASGRYAIPRRDGHLLIGSTLEYEGFDKTPTQAAFDSLKASAEKLIPVLKPISPVKQWAGLRPEAPKGIPYIGKIPGYENVFINAGQFRNGLVLAPASAMLLTDILLKREPIVDPAPYQPIDGSEK